MTKSNHPLNPNFLIFFFLLCLPDLLQAYTAKECSSSTWYSGLSCGLKIFDKISIRFPFCGHPQFDLTCIGLSTAILQLPMSGPFLVTNINYNQQQISINDPGKCLVKRLLTFNTSGSPFTTARFLVDYTFLICPNKLVKPWYFPIACLSNSTHSFLATTDFSLVIPLLPSCEIVKRVSVPVSWMEYGSRFTDLVNRQDLLLKWDSPDCRDCERNAKRCGFKNKASSQVKCFAYQEPGHISKGLQILIITLSVLGGITLFGSCIAFRIYKSNRFVSQRTLNTELATVTQGPDEIIVAARGLHEFIIDSFTKIELGESRRLPGTNGVICPICLSEYESKDIVRCMPECDHCFHLQCIDPWLKIHGSCPICRNSSTLNQFVYDV